MTQGNADARARQLATAALALVTLTPALLAWSWARPIAAAPAEGPALALAPSEVRAAREARAALAEPTGPRAETRRTIYREVNAAEHAAADYPGQAQARPGRLRLGLAALVEELGEPAVAATRAADVARAMRALREGGDADELGGFVRMMERYSMAEAGRQTAPAFVVETALAARWNAVHGRELTEGLSDVELRAYWGWLALHAARAPLDRRLEALRHYAGAGGQRALEGRAAILFEAGDLEGAREAYERAYAMAGTFRLRNHALAAHE